MQSTIGQIPPLGWWLMISWQGSQLTMKIICAHGVVKFSGPFRPEKLVKGKDHLNQPSLFR